MKTYRYYLSFAVIFFLVGTLSAFGQGRVSGIITDANNGEPLPGVNVLIPAQSLGSITGLDGEFTINNVPDGEHIVEATFVGYRTTSQTVTVSGSAITIDFNLNEVATQLDEIVVTGTGGPVEKKRIGNSIGSISTADLANVPINSFSDLLTGREPGLQAIQGGGLVGEGTQIRIRGSASLSQINEPIIIIDGIRVDNGGGFGDNQGAFVGAGGGGSPSRLDDINPEAIERVEILKGAAAATLYGTEASNGVIQIFTKQGARGKPQFDFSTSVGTLTYPKRYPNNWGFTTSDATAQSLTDFYRTANFFWRAEGGDNTISANELIETTATEDLYETGISQSYSLGIRGGTQGLTYYVGGRILRQDGPFGGNDRMYPGPSIKTLSEDLNNRSNFNMNLTVTPTDKVKLKFTTGYTDSYFETMQTNNNIYGTGSLAQFSKPELAGPNNQTGTIAFATVNETLQIEVKQNSRNFNGAFNASYSPFSWLQLDGTVGVNTTNSESVEITPFGWNIDNFTGNNVQGDLDFSNRSFQALSWQFSASARNKISSSLESDFILGGQLIQQQETIDSGSGTSFPGPGFEVSSAAANLQLFNFFQEAINAGVFAQEMIGYKDQLFLTLGGRLDAHSAFGSNFNAAFYPKVAVSWVISDAPFWGTGFGPFSSFQLKAAWGQSGLQPGAFDALTTFEAIAASSGAGIIPENLGNADLEPEISTEFEIGTAIGLLNDKVSIDVTYWDRKVTEAMFSRQFAPSGGFRRSQLVNIGEMEAHGFEIGVSGTVYKQGDLQIDAYANGAYLFQEITDLGGAPPIKVGGSYPRYRNFLIEGFAPGENFGAKLQEVGQGQLPIDIVNGGDGNPDSRAELVSWLADPANVGGLPTSVGTGGVLLADDDGDGDLLDHQLGKNVPDWSGSFGATIKYKRFSLRTNFEYRTGNFYINNLTNAFRQSNGSIGRNLPTSARVNRDWQTGGVDGNFNPQNNGEVRVAALEEWLFDNLALSPFSGLNTIEKGDFLRWRELSLTYSIPKSITSSLGLRNASFTVAGRNIAIWTKYSGVDPEINVFGRGGSNVAADQNFGQGIDAFGWAIPSQLMFTLKAGF
ncbi:MAG: SusC/RagA family TonB-linked outer membrane protein [Cyclobacteriaceae bacterium]